MSDAECSVTLVHGVAKVGLHPVDHEVVVRVEQRVVSRGTCQGALRQLARGDVSDCRILGAFGSQNRTRTHVGVFPFDVDRISYMSRKTTT